MAAKQILSLVVASTWVVNLSINNQIKEPKALNRPLNVRPKILTLRRSVFLWQNIALYLN